MGFSCQHCGKCCEDTVVQINLTFGDIQRLSAGSKKSVAELFSAGIVGFNPFFNPESEKYDIELGLNKPCKLRVNGKCSMYHARPLNCRLFPIWLIARAPADKLPKILSPGFKCGIGLKLSAAEKKAYRHYSDVLGEILLVESEKSDKILGQLKRRFAIPELDLGTPSEEPGIESGRLAIATSIISRMGLGKLQEEVIAFIIKFPCEIRLEQLDSETKKN